MKIKMMAVPYCSECGSIMIYSGLQNLGEQPPDRIQCGKHSCVQFGIQYKAPYQCVQLERAES